MVSFTTEPQAKAELQKVLSQLGADTSILSSDKQMPSLLGARTATASSSVPDFSTLEMNAEANAFAGDYIARNGRSLLSLQQRQASTLTMYDAVLQAHGVPDELKYLSVIESHLNPAVTSHAGAAGPWQFMPEEARRWGLHVGGKKDERRDFKKSTTAAARCLKNLYNEFGDWLLVLAAYNAGPGKVRSAIRKGGQNDFWNIQRFLPLETRNHVKKYIAVHYLLEGHGGETTLSAAETDRYTGSQKAMMAVPMDDVATQKLEVQGRYQAATIARLVGMDESMFDRYNPAFDVAMQRGELYVMELPEAEMKLFKQMRTEALAQSVRALMAAR